VNARRRQAARRNWPANLYQNSSGYLYFKNPMTGKTAGLGNDLKKAIARVNVANLQLEKVKAERDLIAATSSAVVTLASRCDEYEKEFAVGKANTVKVVKSQLNAIRGSALSKKPIDEFTSKDAADMVKQAVEARGARMAQTIRSRLRDVFRDAILHGLVQTNPVDVVLNPRSTVKRARMSESDFWAIHKHAPRWLQNAMLLALHTGQRKSDVIEMQFEHCKDGYLWVTQMKTGMKLKILLSTVLKESSLQSLITQCRDKAVSRYLVHFPAETRSHKRGSKVGVRALDDAFAKAREKSEIAFAEGTTPTTFHEIRSLSARLYSEAYGKDFAQALLGHRAASMTELYKDVRGQQWVEVKAG
jgi:integrase